MAGAPLPGDGVEMTPLEWRAARYASLERAIGPAAAWCDCGKTWLAHHNGEVGTECDDYHRSEADELAWAALEAVNASLIADINAYDDHLYQQRRRKRPPGPRVSDTGDCRRKVWYRELPPADYTPGDTDRRAAAIGLAVHDKAAPARAWRYPWRHHEMEIRVPGLDGLYYVDEYDPLTGLVIDDKTAGEAKWYIVGEGGPTDDMWDQVMIYALALDSQGWPVQHVQIIAVRREDGDEEHFIRDYDPQIALAALDRLTELADMLSLGIVPPRDGYGPSDWQCRYCPALAHCWQTSAAAAAGRSPESYVALGPDPSDAVIIWAAEQAHRLGKDASASKLQHEIAKKLLEGIPDGTYGEYTIKNQKRRMPDYKRTNNRNLGFWVLDDKHKPSYDVVADPEKRIDQYVTVTRVRAAKRRAAAKPEDPLDSIA